MPQPPLPSHAEANTPPTGLTFDIVKPELICQAISEGKSGEIAKALLESPGESVQISVESDGSTFDYISTVSIRRDPPQRRVEDFVAAFTRKIQTDGGEVKERGGNYIFTGVHGTELVIGRESILDRIRISTGITKDLTGSARVSPKLNVTEENVSNALDDVTEALTTLTEEMYQLNDKRPPDQRVEITPPKRRLDKLGKTALGEGGYTELMSKIEIERPKVTFDEIGGQKTAKREIEGLAFALSNPDLYKKWGTKPPKGVLLYGPPGTGKTLMAKALASQAQARFLHVKASDIGSKWYGESEQIVEQIFQFASTNGKTIIYFDEIDSIAPPRDGKHEATQKVIGVLLQSIDGIGSSDNVMIVASTNRLQNIDEAMLRPGRLDRLVEVGLPDQEGVKQILAIHQGKANQTAERELFEDVDTERITEMMHGFSGADIAEIIRRTLEEKVRQEGIGNKPSLVSTNDLVKEIKGYERVREERSRPGQYL